MSSKVTVKNDGTGPQAVIVHFSNDGLTRLLKAGESIDVELSPGMCVNLVESDEDYSHGEGDSSPAMIFRDPPVESGKDYSHGESEPEPSGVIAGVFDETDEPEQKEGE